MTTEERFKLITRNLAEVLTEEDLNHLLESETPLRHYIGFEISGKLHLGHFFQLMKVKDLQEAGAETVIWLADLHSAVNDKLGGDLETIKKVGADYFIPAMKVLFECIGGDPEKLIFKLCSEDYSKHPEFWMTFIEVGKATTLARTKRSITIMGREEQDDSVETAKLMYPMMQAADIFLLGANIAQAGMDQRKVHVVAREAAMAVKTFPMKDSKGNQIKPVAIHTPILLGLQAQEINRDGEADETAMRTKMSKSKADSGVSVHDLPEDIKRKINSAYAPEGVTENNPVLNWVKYLVFYDSALLTIERDEKWGGNMEFSSYEELEKAYTEKNLHPMDLKNALADWLIKKLEPVHKFFVDPKNKSALEEIEALTSAKS
jgi:tyrosyl-tRNA synthetase